MDSISVVFSNLSDSVILQAHVAETAFPGVQLGRGKRGCKSSPYFLEVKKIAEHLGAGMDADSPGQLWAACPPRRCLSSLFALHTHAAELPGAARAVRKTGRRTGGLWAGSWEHGSSWATQRGPRQERPLCWGRAAAGTAAPLVLHIPGGNGIFGGRRAPGRNSKAAFGVRPWLSCWDSSYSSGVGEWGVGGVAAPFGLGKTSP